MGFIIGVFLVTLFDQISKLWIQRSMDLMDSIPVIPGIFHLTYIQNPNSAFGILKFPNKVFIIIAIMVMMLIVFLLRDKIVQKNRLVFFSLVFILGGSLGNMIDRFRIGGVIDFLDFRIWPIFNLADSAINIGLFLLIVHFLLHKEDQIQDDKPSE